MISKVYVDWLSLSLSLSMESISFPLMYIAILYRPVASLYNINSHSTLILALPPDIIFSDAQDAPFELLIVVSEHPPSLRFLRWLSRSYMLPWTKYFFSLALEYYTLGFCIKFFHCPLWQLTLRQLNNQLKLTLRQFFEYKKIKKLFILIYISSFLYSIMNPLSIAYLMMHHSSFRLGTMWFPVGSAITQIIHTNTLTSDLLERLWFHQKLLPTLITYNVLNVNLSILM